MLHLIVVMLPLGLASAVSPVMVTEQAVLLAGPRGRRTALMYAVGTAGVLTAVIAGVVILGHSLALPKAPKLDASLDLTIGMGLILLAAALRWWDRTHPPKPKKAHQLSPQGALAFGVLSMATNVTTLALIVPAAKEIASSQVDILGKVLAAGVLIALTCLPAWGPVALSTAAPAVAAKLLGGFEAQLHRHGRTWVLVCVLAAGLFFLGRGVLRLHGLSVF